MIRFNPLRASLISSLVGIALGCSGADSEPAPGDEGAAAAGADGSLAGAANGAVAGSGVTAGAFTSGGSGAPAGMLQAGAGGGMSQAGNGGGGPQAGAGTNAGTPGMPIAGTGADTAGAPATNAGTDGSGGAADMPLAGMQTTETDPDLIVPDAVAACTINITDYDVSEVIGAVGIVEWNTDLPGLERAVIEFGPDTNYGKRVPADIDAANFRSLVLGMKASSDYHLRIVAVAGEQSCPSEDFTLTTGAAPVELAELLSGMEVTTPLPDQVAPGYIISSRWNSGPGPAFILDEDRDPVWWWLTEDTMGDDVFRARMSYDAKYMWMRNTAQMDGGLVHRVSMDGLDVETWELDATTHDLAVIPDGNIALVNHAENGCDEILEMNPATDEIWSVFNAFDAHSNLDCHVNALAYYEPDDAFIFSDYQDSSYTKTSRTGELLWVLGGTSSTFTMGTTWDRQHNLHMVDKSHIVIFSNGGGDQPTTAFEFLLDETNNTATEVWRYEDGPSTQFGGDVQRLHNGNTMITYSVSGEIREVSADGALVQTMAMSIGDPFAHSVHRDTLYGAPPRIFNLADEAN